MGNAARGQYVTLKLAPGTVDRRDVEVDTIFGERRVMPGRERVTPGRFRPDGAAMYPEVAMALGFSVEAAQSGRAAPTPGTVRAA